MGNSGFGTQTCVHSLVVLGMEGSKNDGLMLCMEGHNGCVVSLPLKH